MGQLQSFLSKQDHCRSWQCGNDQSNVETKEQFYSDLGHVMANANSQTMVMEDLNATIDESMQNVVVRWS